MADILLEAFLIEGSDSDNDFNTDHIIQGSDSGEDTDYFDADFSSTQAGADAEHTQAGADAEHFECSGSGPRLEDWHFASKAGEVWQDIFQRMMDSLSDGQRDNIVCSLSASSFEMTVGTLCSGSDLCVPMLQQEASGIWTQGAGIPMNFKHAFSCENCDYKQEWIQQHFPPDMLFGDAGEVAAGQGRNMMKDELSLVPRVDLYLAGFSCTDVSAMCMWRDQFEERMLVNDGTTAYTLACSLLYIEREKPTYVILENVPGFAVRGGARNAYAAMPSERASSVFQHGTNDSTGIRVPLTPAILRLIGKLEAMGYFVCPMLLDPRSSAIPQRRPRMYLGCSLSARTVSHPDPEFDQGLLRMANDILNRTRLPMVPLDDLLLPTGSDDFRFWDRACLQIVAFVSTELSDCNYSSSMLAQCLVAATCKRAMCVCLFVCVLSVEIIGFQDSVKSKESAVEDLRTESSSDEPPEKRHKQDLDWPVVHEKKFNDNGLPWPPTVQIQSNHVTATRERLSVARSVWRHL